MSGGKKKSLAVIGRTYGAYFSEMISECALMCSAPCRKLLTCCLLLLFRLFQWVFFWNRCPCSATCCRIKAQVLGRVEAVLTHSGEHDQRGLRLNACTLGKGGVPAAGTFLLIPDEVGWGESCALHSLFTGQCFLHLNVRHQKTVASSSAWYQLGFEKGCLKDAYCLIFTAGEKWGLLSPWNRGGLC